MKYYFPPTIPELKGYIYCRENNHKGSLPQKGTLEENLGGVQKLVYIAHSVCMKPILYEEHPENIGDITTIMMEEIVKENNKEKTDIITLDEIADATIEVGFANNKKDQSEFEITKQFALKVQIFFKEQNNSTITQEVTNEILESWNVKLKISLGIFK